MHSAPNRPWYRLHWVTLVVVTVVIAALVYRELKPARIDGGHAFNGSGRLWLDQVEYGWPFVYARRLDSVWTPAVTRLVCSTDWRLWALFMDSVFCCLIACATAGVAEGWLRGPALWQVS